MGGITRPTRLRSVLPDLRMDPALGKLLKLRLRGRLRQMFRGLRTPRGAVFFVIGVIIIFLWLGPSVAMVALNRPNFHPTTLRAMIPLGLLALCLLNVLASGQQKGIAFSEAEIDMLFAGPFTRRELLLFKMSVGTLGTVFVALVFSVVFLRYTHFWLAALVGSLVTLLFIQLFTTALVLIGQTVAEHAFTRARRIALLVVAALAGIGLAEAARSWSGQGAVDFAAEFRYSWAGIVLLAPVEVFGRTILAQTVFPELVGWGSLAVLIDVALLTLVLRLDVNYQDAAIVASQKLYRRVKQARRGSLAWSVGDTGRVHLPQLPRLGGAGPIVRKQLIHAVRTSRGMLFFLVVMGLPVGFMLVGSSQDQRMVWTVLPCILVFSTLFFIQAITFDFRGDLDQMESLKALPLGDTAIAVGQLVVPCLILTLVHLIVLGLAAVAIGQVSWVLAAMALFCPPLNFLFVALENLLFLAFPARITPAMPGDLQHVGRTIVLMAVKMLTLLALCGLAAALGAVTYFVCGGSWIAALSAAWLVLATMGAILVPCVAAAYRRFDVSLDTPP